MPQLKLGGANMSYSDDGEGEPLVLLHGWIGSGALWDLTAPWLSEFFRVIVPDLPGHGDSGIPAGFSFSLDGFSSFIDELRAALELPTINLVGHSMGGCIAVHYAARHAEVVGRLVLIDTPARAGALNWQAKLPGIDKLLGLLYPLWGPRIVTRLIKSSVRHPEELPDDFLERAVAQACKLHKEALVGTTRLIRALDLDAEIQEIEAPVLIMQGDHDPSVNPAGASSLRDTFKDAHLQMVLDCGHCPNYEYPELVVELVAGFISPDV